MPYKVTLTKDAAQIQRLKEKGAMPFVVGGIPFSEDTVHICEDISIFAHDPRYKGFVPPDPRLVVEEIESTDEVDNG